MVKKNNNMRYSGLLTFKMYQMLDLKYMTLISWVWF
jgi:hypothetical protein